MGSVLSGLKGACPGCARQAVPLDQGGLIAPHRALIGVLVHQAGQRCPGSGQRPTSIHRSETDRAEAPAPSPAAPPPAPPQR